MGDKKRLVERRWEYVNEMLGIRMIVERLGEFPDEEQEVIG